jgi:hypothetical protein
MAELLMELGIDLCEASSTNGSSRLPPSAYIIKGGVFAGRRLKGHILPQAGAPAFSPVNQSTGMLQFDLCTEDGHTICLSFQGMSLIEPEVLRQILDGQDVPRAAYRHQIAPIFRAESARYVWLNQVEAMGIGWLKPNLAGIGYTIYTIS